MNFFIIGNSFSQDATRYLPQLAASGGHELHFGRAEVGGCSLQRHWEHVEAAERGEPEGGFYEGKSLRELMAAGTWDMVTMQQASINSSNLASYRPYARRLYDYVRGLAPQAEIVMHQTWAYRSDSTFFGELGEGRAARDQREMYEKSRAAYHAIAQELSMRLIPTGDALANLDSDEQWQYRLDTNFPFENPVYPNLPSQDRSLQVGYFWDDDHNFGADYKHASPAGCYLGSLVWNEFLFGQSPSDVKFAPPEIPAEFTTRLRAWRG